MKIKLDAIIKGGADVVETVGVAFFCGRSRLKVGKRG